MNEKQQRCCEITDAAALTSNTWHTCDNVAHVQWSPTWCLLVAFVISCDKMMIM